MFNFNKITTEIIKNIESVGSNNYIHVTPNEIPLNPFKGNWKPKPCVMITKYESSAERIKNFECRFDDIWIVTFPKCGLFNWFLLINFEINFRL